MAIENACQISVTNRQQVFKVPKGELLLMAMEKLNQRAIDVGCRGGGCGLCKVKVLQGDYQTKRMSKAHVNEEELTKGFALACRLMPLSDLVLESDHFKLQKQK
ncbi:MAG: 2Fe-2S iron-sulfur cluster binding domain-containing protein [Pseudomonadaceae bacterium]|nr:2Fe-2S iron-sulfur cluster binding domain-containing protein [Pseudomonadaceae bacterium]